MDGPLYSFDSATAKARCRRFRRRILDISQQVSALHIGSAYSCTEIVDCIYFGLMRRSPDGGSPDTFLMSKGHGCMIQYVILEETGVLSRADLDAYCTPGGRLGVHPDYGNPGIAAATGSLGHGLSMVCGMALAERGRRTGGMIYTVLSDGEVQEGSTWEATMMASSLGLDNIVAFIDNNDFQSLGRTSETHPSFYPVAEKFRAFGWEAVEVDGHDSRALFEAVTGRSGGKPLMVVAKTTKGKGVSYMENVPIWHYRSPNKDEYQRALRRAGGGVVRNTFSEALYQEATQNPDVYIVVADISPAGSMAKFSAQYPERFINVGVAEQSMIGICAGLALKGCQPFAYTIATFSLYRPFEMVRDDLCYQNLPVTVVGMGAGVIYSTLGGTHHTMEDIAIAGAIPNMQIVAPCDPAECTEATRWCARQKNGPVYLRIGKAGEPDLTKGAEPWRFGKLRYLRRGSDVCILSYGVITKMAMAARRSPGERGQERLGGLGAHGEASRSRGHRSRRCSITGMSSSSRSTCRRAASRRRPSRSPGTSRPRAGSTPSPCRTASSTTTAAMTICSRRTG